jgi:hypothetical protein
VDYDEHRRIVDPLLSRCIEKAEDQRRHIVGDLERLSVKVGPDELQQIKNHAPAIAKGLRFDLQRTRGSSGSSPRRFVVPPMKDDGGIRAADGRRDPAGDRQPAPRLPERTRFTDAKRPRASRLLGLRDEFVLQTSPAVHFHRLARET